MKIAKERLAMIVQTNSEKALWKLPVWDKAALFLRKGMDCEIKYARVWVPI